MHFGLADTLKNMKLVLISIICGAVALSSCKSNDGKSSYAGFKLPEQGQSFGLGQEVKVELEIPANEEVKKISYLLDGKPLGTQDGTGAYTFATKGLSLGYKQITAILENGNTKDTVTTNIVLKSSIQPKLFNYKVINVFPHDTSSYTQGLEYHGGRLLESTGEYGSSSLRWVDLKTGKALQRVDLDPKYFAEGSTLIGDKIILLTWRENVGFTYDAKTLKQNGTFTYQNSREGWGLTFDGKRIIKSDGTNRIWFLNKDTYKEESYVDVYDNNGPVDQLNELEYIDGKIYANIYQSDNIAIIDPNTGAIEGYANLTGILPAKDKFANTDVLNGIAWDAVGKRLFVTGKKFDKLFEISLIPVTK